MDLQTYLKQCDKDPNLFWRLSSGDHLNLLEEALENLENVQKLPEPNTPDSKPLNEAEIDKALDEYEFNADDEIMGKCTYKPTDAEKLLIKDFVFGLLDLNKD